MHYLINWLKVLIYIKIHNNIAPTWSVFNDHHQGALSAPNLCDVAACRRAACVLCAVQSETVSLCTAHNTHAARHAATSPNIYI